MTIRKTTLAMLIAAALMPLAAPNVHAQTGQPGAPDAQAPQRVFTQAELDQMLAPIALYPDTLLSQVLMAATYPIEVVEAARWTRANPNLSGDAAVRAVENQDWDPSVKSLVAFPQIVQRMDEQLQWTQTLGDAFLDQEAAVMDTVQQLRRRAQAAGNLQSNEQIRVQQQGPTIVVQSPPQVVYVPYYDPLVVYGPWWHPAYRPVVWAPWPGYARPRPGISVNLWWGAPVSVSANFFFGDFDWGRRQVRVAHPTAYYYKPPRVVVNNTTIINRNVTVERNVWQHDPAHRRGTTYRTPEARQRFAAAQPDRRDEKREAIRDERKMERRAATEPRAPSPQVVNRAQEAKAQESKARENRPQERRAAEAKAAQPAPQAEARKDPPQAEARKEAPKPQAAQRSVQDSQRNAQRDAQREERRQADQKARQERMAQAREKADVQMRQKADQAPERPKAEVRERPQAQPQERPQAQVRQERPEQRPEPRAEQRPEQRAQPRQEQRQEQRQERQERGERGGGKGADKS